MKQHGRHTWIYLPLLTVSAIAPLSPSIKIAGKSILENVFSTRPLYVDEFALLK